MADWISVEVAVSLSIIILAALVWLMYKEAIKPSWGEISQGERQARRAAEAKK